MFKKFLDTVGEATEVLFDELLNSAKTPTEKAIDELKRLTVDETSEEVVKRALGTYLSIVKHVKAGGSVKYVGKDGAIQTLKVHLK